MLLGRLSTKNIPLKWRWRCFYSPPRGAHIVDLRLKDKVILITGGAKGIGAAIARTIAEEGAIPVIIHRDQDAAEKLHEELRPCHGYSYLVVAELNTAEACFDPVRQTDKKLCRINAPRHHSRPKQ